MIFFVVQYKINVLTQLENKPYKKRYAQINELTKN